MAKPLAELLVELKLTKVEKRTATVLKPDPFEPRVIPDKTYEVVKVLFRNGEHHKILRDDAGIFEARDCFLRDDQSDLIDFDFARDYPCGLTCYYVGTPGGGERLTMAEDSKFNLYLPEPVLKVVK